MLTLSRDSALRGRSYKCCRQLFAVIDFREVQIASNGNQGKQITPCNSRTKLRMKLLHIQKRDNVEFYLCCKFQLLPFSVLCKTDGMTNKQTNYRYAVDIRPSA